MTPTVSDQIGEALSRRGIVAILRGVPAEQSEPLAAALVEGGINILEVAISTPASLGQLESLSRSLGNDVLLGAGTVTSAALAEAAVAAGATFLVTPHVIAEVNAFGKARGIEVLGGALTPGEIASAREQGNRFVKVFPAAVMGPAYFSALLGPYPEARLLAVGGVNASNAEAFMRAGAVGVGVGGALTTVAPRFDRRQVVATAGELVAAVGRGKEVRS